MIYPHDRPSSIILGLLGVVSIWMFEPRQASACHEIRLCATINPTQEDIQFGTFPGASLPWPARGVRVTIIRPYPEPPLGLYLDQVDEEAGCTTFESQFHAGFKFLVYPEAVLGSENNIRIKAFSTEHIYFEDTTPEFVNADPLSEGGEFRLEIPLSDVWSLIAVASHVVHRIDTDPLLGTSPFTGLHTLRIQQTNGLNSDGGFSVVHAGENAPNHKFVIGHEIGHWVQAQVTMAVTNDVDYYYSYAHTGVKPPCQFRVVGDQEAQDQLGPHGIRSAEHSSAAMLEGFGHFVASVAFNPVDSEYGIFRYYKEIEADSENLYGPFIDEDDGNYRVQLKGGEDSETLGGESAWVRNLCADENLCEDDWNWPLDDCVAGHAGEEISSEIDWMRFFWRLTTADEGEFGTSMAFWQIADLLAYAHAPEHEWGATGPLYCNLFGALMDSELSGFEDRFKDLTEENGIYNGSPDACFP